MSAYLLTIHWKRKKSSWFTPVSEIYGSGDVLVHALSLNDAKSKARDFYKKQWTKFEVTDVVSKTIL